MTGVLLAAVWMGFLCAASPCPMAANLATVGYLARQVDKPGRVLLSGFAYGFGRMVSCTVLAALLVSGLSSAPALSQGLLKYGDRVTGPVLLLVGLVLLDLLPFRLPRLAVDPGRGIARLADAGMGGAFLLGVLFALAMCPPSAALFFGGLIPLAVENASPVLLPLAFGGASAFPVILAALLLAFSANTLGRVFDRMSCIERIVRLVTGIGLLFLGIWKCAGVCASIWIRN